MIAFDIGTERSKAACVNRLGKPEMIPNARGEPFTPSVVCLSEGGPPLVGRDALEQGYVHPERTARNFKLKLGTTENILRNGKTVTATDATAELVGRLKENVESHLGVRLEELVATCPANFRDAAKQALLEAFDRHGIKVSQLVHEPTAAGLAYALDKSGSTLHIAVYDFGGGTFDVSILKVEGPQISVLATEGVAQLGGNDINACLRRHILNEIKVRTGEDITLGQDSLFDMDLDTRVEAAKLSLGTRPQVPVAIHRNGNQLIVDISQDQLHRMIDPLIRQTLDALDHAIDAAGLKADQVQDILMVGGTSRLKHIQGQVAKHIGKAPKIDIDPDKAVAYGAAIASLNELYRQGKTATIRGQIIPSPDLFVREVTAHAVGCCVVDTSGPQRRMLNAAIIAKNTQIPCRKTDRFYLERADQAHAKVEILQGEPDADRDECLVIGELLLENLPSEPNRSARIQIEYSIDGNGMVTATATDIVSGQIRTVSVDYKRDASSPGASTNTGGKTTVTINKEVA